ncbi:uncharacterized protein [Patagioenas fasciata]|uniref:uncharacterized protein isoform X1 n=1 Tax=Patagioenas fasciata TaxID=372321 RepID=UPI003A98E9FB
MIRGEGAGSARGGRPGVPASRGGCSGPPRPLATAPARWQAGHFQCSLPPPAACPGLRPVRWHRRREGYAPTPLLFHEVRGEETGSAAFPAPGQRRAGGGALPGCPRARARMEPATPWRRHHAWACTGPTEREEPGRIRAWEVSGEGRHVPGGMTVQGSKTGLRVDACRWEPWAYRARSAHACVRRDIPAVGVCRIIIPPPPSAGGPWGLSRQSPHPVLKREDNPPGAERRSAGARRWLRADGSGTSKSPHQIPGGFKKFAAICPNRAAALCRGPRGAHGLPRDKLSRSQPRRAPSPAPAPPVRALGAAAETDGSLRRPPRPPRTLHRARHPPAQRPAEENKNVCRL